MVNELHILLQTMKAAGAAIVQIQQSGFKRQKSNGDLVTEADLLANEMIKQQLLGHFPQDGWLSEENKDDFSRLDCQRVWIVDPIDGTKEFAAQIPEYAISVALVENGEPILGSIYHPATQSLFYAIRNQGVWLGQKKITCKKNTSPEIHFLASRHEYERGEWERFRDHHEVKPLGSIAYKLALIAAGNADATFSLNPKNEWDIAAGVLLVKEAGGKVTNKYGQEIYFNRKNTKVDGIVASSKALHAQIMKLIA